MRILHVLHSHGYGGAENHVLMMMKGQREAGHDVMFAGPLDSWLGQACQEAQIAAHHVPMHGLYDPWSHWKLRRIAKRWQSDIVHGHLIRGSMYAGMAASRRQHPLAICTAHATTAATHMDRCAHIIAVSDAVRQNLKKARYPDSKITVIHNGVPDTQTESTDTRESLRQALGIPSDVTAVVNAGRFIFDKGQDLLVQAIKQTDKNVHLYLIGDPNTAFGTQILSSNPDPERVHFLGYRQDVQRILPAFDIYALSSRREALSLSLIEAYVAGLATVGTKVGGVPEILLNDQTGLLVPPNDAESLARAIMRLHQNPEIRHRFAKAGRQHYEHHLTDKLMVTKTLEVYLKALQARGS